MVHGSCYSFLREGYSAVQVVIYILKGSERALSTLNKVKQIDKNQMVTSWGTWYLLHAVLGPRSWHHPGRQITTKGKNKTTHQL